MDVVRLTDTAISRIENLSARNPGKLVKLSAKTGGCAGYRYGMEYVDTPSPGDETVPAGNTSLIIDGKSLVFLMGLQIDWTETASGMGFSYDNPGQTSACGCGESFTCA